MTIEISQVAQKVEKTFIGQTLVKCSLFILLHFHDFTGVFPYAITETPWLIAVSGFYNWKGSLVKPVQKKVSVYARII